MAVTLWLKRIGHEVELARNGTEAVSLYRNAIQSGQAFDAVVLDLTIPDGVGGVETIKNLLELDPDVKAVVASGYSNDPVMSKFKEYGFKGAIGKPYESDELDEVLQNVIMEKS